MAWSDLFAVVKDAVFGTEDVLSNRRKQPRIVMQLPVRCRLDGPDFPAELVDLGLRGLRLALPQRVRRDQTVIVSALPGDGVAGRPELRCSVVWCRQNPEGVIQAGVVYNDTSENLATSWVHYLLLQRNFPVGERKDRRIEAGVPVEVQDTDHQSVMVGQVVDLSMGGAKIRVPHRLPAQDRFVLKIGATNPKLKPVILDAQVVGSPPPSEAGGSDGDIFYGLRFVGGDSQNRQLKRLLLSLLQDLRKERRPRSAAVSGVRQPTPPPPPPRPQGPLASAVSSGFVEGPKKPEKARKPGTSKFLRSQPPDFLRSPPAPKEEPMVWEPPPPPPKWRVAVEEERPAREVTGAEGPGGPEPPRRPLVEGLVAFQHPGLEVQRGWFHRSYLGSLPLYAWLPDQAARPTEEFFLTVAPMLPGCPLLFGLHDLSVWTRNSMGPGLVWSSRLTYFELQRRLRRPAQWLINTARTRERLERRQLSLQERLLHLLAVQGLGGGQAVRSLVAGAQIACAMARELGLEDTLALSHLRLAALVKDIGEAALILGLAPKAQRERWSFFLHGVDTPNLELEELVSDWPGFRAKSDLLVARYSPGPDQLELLPLHPVVAEGLLSELGFPEAVLYAVRSHHEAYNGSGYPDGLAGHDIPWGARCLAVADTFAGFLADNVPPAEALAFVQHASGTMFDPDLVKALREYLIRLQVC